MYWKARYQMFVDEKSQDVFVCDVCNGVHFLEDEAKSCIGTTDLKKRILGKLESLLARSGWEMLPAKIFVHTENKKGYYEGIKEMEKVWHDIIGEVIEEIKKTKEGRE